MKKNDSTSDNGSINKTSDKQKIAILKKAVLELREQKTQFEQTIRTLTEQVRERSESEAALTKTVQELQLKLRSYQQPSHPAPRIQSQSLFSASTLNVLLGKGEVADEQHVQQVNRQLKQLQAEMEIQKNNQEAQMSVIQLAYKDLERDYKSKDQQVFTLSKEVEDKIQLSTQLKQNLEDIERELYTRIKDLQNQLLQQQLKVKAYETEVHLKEEEVKEMDRKLEEQRFKCVQLTSEIEESRGKYIQYRLTLKGVVDVECHLILRQNIFNEYIFELETAAQRYTYKALDVTDLKAKEDNQFTLTIKQGNKMRIEVFQTSQDLKKTCKTIKHFLQRSTQVVQMAPSQQSQQSGLFQGIISIFNR